MVNSEANFIAYGTVNSISGTYIDTESEGTHVTGEEEVVDTEAVKEPSY